ncbi:histidine N-acetyltransferase-like [Haliotis rufescens]|uniref:histidine N-acetyltransferase-like n=1 Tax=Haliotis rufescens TaxID=6454 RepID=UPI00201EF684|nr:histidine N-acetyltransferase-like [Haliotis rufescens]
MSIPLTFREVDDADYDAVMGVLPDAWEGRDYLPDKYPEYVADPDCTCFACEVEGDMVGFHAALIVDKGETMVRIGGRVKVTYQGQGIFQALLRHMYKAHGDNDQLKYESIVVIDTQAERLQRQYADQHGYSHILQKKRYLYKFESTGVQMVNCWPQSRVPHRVTASDMSAIISSGSICRTLFPDGRVFLHCKPYKLVASNIRHFMHKTLILASVDGSCLPCGNHACAEETESTNYGGHSNQFLENIALFSIGDFYHQKSGLHYNIELYGDDLESLPEHLSRHISYIKSIATPSVDLVVHTHVRADVRCIDDVMNKYGVMRDNMYVETIHLFERPFSTALKETEPEIA